MLEMRNQGGLALNAAEPPVYIKDIAIAVEKGEKSRAGFKHLTEFVYL